MMVSYRHLRGAVKLPTYNVLQDFLDEKSLNWTDHLAERVTILRKNKSAKEGDPLYVEVKPIDKSEAAAEAAGVQEVGQAGSQETGVKGPTGELAKTRASEETAWRREECEDKTIVRDGAATSMAERQGGDLNNGERGILLFKELPGKKTVTFRLPEQSIELAANKIKQLTTGQWKVNLKIN